MLPSALHANADVGTAVGDGIERLENMADTSASPTFVRCPGCGERLGVRAGDAGKKARCGKCGLVFVIDAKAEGGGGKADGGGDTDLAKPRAEESTPRPQFDDELPASVTFACSLCDTRITAATRNAGKKVKCPDCGRVNVIPLPEKPKVKQAPAAMSGEQIELLDADARSWEEQQTTATEPAPTLHAVECKLCATRMYATEDQIGRELKCPDCGTLTVAKRSAPKPKPKLPELVGKEYELDPESKPTKRYVPVPVAARDAEMHAHARATTVGPDGRLIVKKEAEYQRPVRPKNPLVTGVWRMVFTQEVIARWMMSSILFGIAAWFLFSALVPAMSSVAQGIMAIFMSAFGAVMTMVWLTFAAPTFLTIIGESAEGHDRIQEPPTWSPLEGMSESFQLAAAIGAAGLLGAACSWGVNASLAAANVTLPRESTAAILATVSAIPALVVFPLALLGTLLENSPFGVVSPRLLSTLFKCPGPWLLFYVESALLAAVAGAMGFGAFLAGPPGMILLPLIAMGMLTVYTRLLGRLAWWISEATAVEEDEEFHDETAAAHPHLAAARKEAHERRRRGEAD
jgi:DNA-directed RNA polymerase subunit M/transcription elongation factor TFIIS